VKNISLLTTMHFSNDFYPYIFKYFRQLVREACTINIVQYMNFVQSYSLHGLIFQFW